MATYHFSGNKNWLNRRNYNHDPINSNESFTAVCLKNALTTLALLLSGFMAFCAVSQQLAINQLSVINFLILALGVFFTLQDLSPTGEGGSLDYFEGLKAGLLTTLLAVSMYALFIGIYSALDPSVLRQFSGGVLQAFEPNPWRSAGIALFEGLAGGFVISFCLMQYFKKY